MQDIKSVVERIKWAKVCIYSIILIGIYYQTSQWLLGHHWAMDDFGYGYLVPLVVLYLIWDKKDSLLKIRSRSTWVGLIPLALGIVLFWIGELAGEYFTQYISFWLVIVGCCWLHLGWEKLKLILFPLIFMLSMFPPPDYIYNRLSLYLKLLSSRLGVDMMRFLGMSAYREGNVIDLGFTQLQVVDACSGLRYFFPLIVLGLLLSYFYKAALWKKIVLVVSTIPISIIVNSLRIASVGVLYPIWGRAVAEGFFHDFSGWFIFMVSLGILLGEMWVLKKIFPEKSSSGRRLKIEGGRERDDDSRTEDLGLRTEEGGNEELGVSSEKKKVSSEESVVSSEKLVVSSEGREVSSDKRVVSGEESVVSRKIQHSQFNIKNLFSPPQFVVAVILLLLTFVFSQGVEFREKVPMNKSFFTFPLKVGKWRGESRRMEQKIVDTLDLSDYVMVDYKNEVGKAVQFYVAYYESQRKGESIHSPETCLPGGGWIFHDAGKAVIPVDNGNDATMTVKRAVMQKSGYKQLVYFWFPMRGRTLTNAYEMKFYTFLDALTLQRTDGALVRIITLVYPDEDIRDAEARLQGFSKEIVPILNNFLPQ